LLIDTQDLAGSNQTDWRGDRPAKLAAGTC